MGGGGGGEGGGGNGKKDARHTGEVSDFANRFPATEALGCRNMQILFWKLIPFVGTNEVSHARQAFEV